ncbi:hypothetical protein K474DRAFT_317202 [Panus rudis PR-1116 ss-1]|nr:hypothetical protein K474DRAFT_317202 [Panus rudis PR-1116 ss-1]
MPGVQLLAFSHPPAEEENLSFWMLSVAAIHRRSTSCSGKNCHVQAGDEKERPCSLRSTPPGPAPEAAVHPLLQDPSSSSGRAGANVRATRRLGRATIPGIPQNLLQTIENAIGEGAVNLFHHIISQRRGTGETIRVDVPPGGFIPHYLQRHGHHGFSASIRLERAPRSGDRSSDHKSFEPFVTIQRWAGGSQNLVRQIQTQPPSQVGQPRGIGTASCRH